MYLDFQTELIGTQVADTDGVISALRSGTFDLAAYEPFIARHLGNSSGHASERFVARFLPD